jgi:hypothetical protein
MVKVVRLLPILLLAACAAKKKDASKKLSSFKQYRTYVQADSMAQVNPDSAYSYYANAAEKITDSLYKGSALQKMAKIQQDAQDYHGSNESAIESASLFNENMDNGRYRISYSYNILATNCMDLGRYTDAMRYYDTAIKYGESSNLPDYKCNKAVLYQQLKKYDSAIVLFENILTKPQVDTDLYCRLRSNLAKTNWLKNPNYSADKDFHEARLLSELINDQPGLHASYMHLADYYRNIRPDSAKYYAEKMYSVATALHWPAYQAEALEKLTLLASGNTYRDYLQRYIFLKDSINKARMRASNQFAYIRYDYKTAKADNLVLEKDNSEKKLRIVNQRVIIYSTIGLFALLSFLGIHWYRKRKRLQELHTRNAIRESELKTSQKVHDVVANGLYRIMNEVEHKEHIEKESLLDKIEDLYEQSRDISYEKAINPDENFSATLNAILSSFASSTTRVLMVGNDESLWRQVAPPVQNDIKAVLQELMVNMAKHSQAKNVVVNFERKDNSVFIRYKDDGIGLKENVAYGNGLRNTGNRILGIGGKVIFDNNPGKGLTIEISFPTNKPA